MSSLASDTPTYNYTYFIVLSHLCIETIHLFTVSRGRVRFGILSSRANDPSLSYQSISLLIIVCDLDNLIVLVAEAQRSLLLLSTPATTVVPCAHSSFYSVHIPKQHFVLIKLWGVSRWLSIVCCLVPHQSSEKTLQIYGSKIAVPKNFDLTHLNFVSNSPSSHGDLRF